MDYPGHIVRRGETDDEIVAVVRRRLAELSFDVALAGPFDVALERAVKLFQTRAVDQLGRNLLADGKVGPLTWAALFAMAPEAVTTVASPVTARALEIAASQVGARENPRDSNRGPEVEGYLASVGLGPGYPWCAAFVYWCLQQASTALGMPHHCRRTGGVLRQWQHALAENLPRVTAADARQDPSRIKPGMVFIVDHGGGLGHTGFVRGVAGGYFDTIEGNTDASRTREGGGVYALTRKVGEINKGYVLYG